MQAEYQLDLPVAARPFQPSWESLKQYQCPKWFRDAKFGIWAHWTAQNVLEQGDWYAKYMYDESHPHYKYHVEHYGHPSKFGFKDIDNLWKMEKWDTEKLIGLYKRAGAQYFVALAHHHDNFDCFDSNSKRFRAGHGTRNAHGKTEVCSTEAANIGHDYLFCSSVGASPSVFPWGRALPWPDETLFERLQYRSLGKTVQSHGLFARHVKGITLRNVKFSTKTPDARPAVVLEDVTDADIEAK